jgi:hypothetical protein
MGEVVELWSVGSFRAMFLAEEWQQLVDSLNDYAKVTRAHLSLCRDWEKIWDQDASDNAETKERRLMQLGDAELLGECYGCEAGNPELDLIAGEMERRNLDESR